MYNHIYIYNINQPQKPAVLGMIPSSPSSPRTQHGGGRLGGDVHVARLASRHMERPVRVS